MRLCHFCVHLFEGIGKVDIVDEQYYYIYFQRLSTQSLSSLVANNSRYKLLKLKIEFLVPRDWCSPLHTGL